MKIAFRHPLHLLVLALLVGSCASQVPVPQIPTVDSRNVLSGSEDATVEALATSSRSLPQGPITPPAKARLPQVGEQTSYGVTVSAELSAAIEHQFAGRHQEALELLERLGANSAANANLGFEVSLLQAQNTMALGRFDDAETAVERAEAFEQRLFKTNVNSRALLGEIKFWASDYDAAQVILEKVAAATRAWKLPTSYGGPPTNLPELFDLTTAQLRAYTTLAALHMAQNDFESARPWAILAELGFADVFYVSYHPIYGPFVPTHADSFYGRALNLAVLGATTMVVAKDRKVADSQFDAALKFLDSIGFSRPRLTVEAIRAQALLASGAITEAARLAERLTAEAIQQNQADLVWRIETLRGEALYQNGDAAAAQKAFRAAQSAVDVVFGRLTADRSKRRFGIGKETITQRLAEIDIANNDMAALFDDLDRGRARAFVDLLADQAVAVGRQKQLTDSIRSLDRKIRDARLRAAAPIGSVSTDQELVEALLQSREARVAELRSVDPELADIFGISVGTLASVQEALGSNEIMLYGIPGDTDQNIRLLAVTKASANVRTLDITHDRLRRDLRTFRAAKTADAQKSALAKISDALIDSDWREIAAAHIVPTGQLYFVPWGALDIETPVAVLPTGSWVGRVSAPSIRKGAVIVGDPAFHGDLPQLAGAREEARRLGAQYVTEPLIGTDATTASLRTRVGSGVATLHIATHAKFDARAPLKSALFLSGNGSAEALTAGSIFERPFAAGLVVLSACETGVGRAVAGDDFLGLARSFYLGGAHTVLNSLWPVDDAGTLAFMTEFHASVGGGDIGKAWLSARNTLKKRGLPPSVYGAFVVGGALRN